MSDSGVQMLRLTFLLCVALFLTLLIGGQDRGQLRPGLAPAQKEAAVRQERAAALALAEAAPRPVADIVEAAFAEQPVEVVAPAVVEPVVAEPAPTDAAQVEATLTSESNGPVAADPSTKVVYVTASAVNVREGPGTNYAVLGRLTRGETATLVWSDDTGWSRIRIEGDGMEGFIASSYVSSAAP
jgi:uncharacterized protein YgiM (DUF1202 family)